MHEMADLAPAFADQRDHRDVGIEPPRQTADQRRLAHARAGKEPDPLAADDGKERVERGEAGLDPLAQPAAVGGQGGRGAHVAGLGSRQKRAPVQWPAHRVDHPSDPAVVGGDQRGAAQRHRIAERDPGQIAAGQHHRARAVDPDDLAADRGMGVGADFHLVPQRGLRRETADLQRRLVQGDDPTHRIDRRNSRDAGAEAFKARSGHGGLLVWNKSWTTLSKRIAVKPKLR